MLKKPQVGGYLKYYCPRCKLELGHTILAVVNGQAARVRCDTCRGERNYKVAKVKEILERAPRAVRMRVSDGAVYQQKLKESATKPERDYKAVDAYEQGDILNHKIFGRGVVMKLVHPDRMEVLFHDQGRVLMRKADTEENS